MSSLIDHFKPVLQIYPSEYRRKIYLNEFIKYAYTNSEDDESPNFRLDLQYNIDHIFRSYAFALDETDAVVIASFISYLGTNGGFSLLNSFVRNSESKFFKNREDAFLYTWHVENSRRFGYNNNYRTIEYLLTPIEKHDLHRGLTKFSIDDIKQSNYEVIEYLVRWLSTPKGITYILTCQDLIEQEKEKTYEIRKMAREPKD